MVNFGAIKPFTALVIGDFMLDTYTTGRVKRISPEAPVPVMEVVKQESRPGGAGNVVLNLTTLGAKVISVGRIGNDAAGDELKKQFGDSLVLETGYRTPVKNRFVSDSQQLMRVDFETVSSLPKELEAKVIDSLKQIIPTVQVVAISDYGKGFLTGAILAAAIRMAKEAKVPLIVDPKGIDFTKYRGAYLIKPNLSEAYAAAKLPTTASLDEVASVLLQITSAELLLITRSEAGISLFDGTRTDFPVRSKEVKDVTGAGDTVLATLCLAVANGLDIAVAVQLANIAAGISIERIGCVQVTLSEMAKRLLEFNLSSKIFDENHTYALHQVLKDRRYTLLVLNPGQEMSNALFKTIRQLSKERELIIYTQENELIDILTSINEVHFIIQQRESLKHLCETIHPHEIYILEKDRLHSRDLLSMLLHANVIAKKDL